MAVTENPMFYTDSSTYSLHSRGGVDTGEDHRNTQTTAKSDHFKKDHRLGRTDDWQTPKRQKCHAPKVKGGRTNETILAVISQWIVEHQVGTL